MLDWIEFTKEYENWGFNIATLSALGTFFFTTWQLLALFKQYRNLKTGVSVSVVWNTYFAANFFAFIFYAYDARSVAMGFNAMLGFGHLLVVWGLWKVMAFTWFQKAFLVTLVLQPLFMWLTPLDIVDLGLVEVTWRQVLFWFYSLGTIFAFYMMPYAMKQAGERGDLSFGLLVSYVFSTGFWWLFAVFAVADPVLIFLTTSAGAIICYTFYLWSKFDPAR